MQKILIDAMMINGQNTGLGVYACEVLERLLPKLREKYEVTILCAQGAQIREKIGITDVPCIELAADNALKRELNVGRYIYKCNEYDLFYSLSQHGFPRMKMRNIVTVHDVIPRLYPKGRWHQYLYYTLYLPFVIRSAERVLTVSESTAKDLRKLYSCRNVEVAYNGTNFSKCEVKAAEWKSTQKKRYITVGVHYPYKNLHSIIDLFINDERFAQRELIIIGKSDNAYGQQLKKQVESGDAEGRIRFTGYVSDAEKQTYLSTAYAMIYPSKYEGFGLPVLEGMAQGLPVACSNTSSLPEIAGDAAVMFDPENLTDIANKILMLDDEALCQKLVAKGTENIKRFTWEACANKIRDVIDDVLQ